jgi:pseudouridine-5'-phosphate glycosidase
LEEAESQRVVGRELTPFLLSRMAQASAGATLKANIALLENNARVGAQIALALR